MKKLTKASSPEFAQLIQKRLLIIFGFMVVLLIVIQSIILASVGTIGPKITSLDTDIEHLKLDNEVKLAQIRELNTSGRVVPVVQGDLEMGKTELVRLELINSTDNVFAGAN